MKILLLGCYGQLGWELQRSLSVLGELVCLGSRSETNPQHLCGDLANSDGLRETLRKLAPDAVVNAAAYTAVDRAESDLEQARAVNAVGPATLAEVCARSGAWLLHYSTDYVFDGSGTAPWREADATAPLSVYGQTKLEGERAVQMCPRHLILRTSWVYGSRGGNFARTMLRLASERDSLSVVSDQIGAPTGADLLADVSAHALAAVRRDPQLAGLYHCAAGGETSWHGYATHVLGQAARHGWALRVQAQDVQAIPSSQYPTPARRPLNSRLACDKLQSAFGLRLPPWQQGVERMLDEISGGDKK